MALAKRQRPGIPEPQAVLCPRFGLGFGVGQDEIASPGGLFPCRHGPSVLLCHLAVLAPQQLAEIHMTGQHHRFATLAGPVEGGLQAMRKATVEWDRLLQGFGSNAHLTDGTIGVYPLPIGGIDQMVVGVVLSCRWERPVFPLVREGIMAPGGLDNRHTLLEQLAVDLIFSRFAVPRTGSLYTRHC